jgi:hypothetical protein
MRFCLTLLTAPSHHAILWFALQVPRGPRPRRVPPSCRQVCRRLLHLHRLQPGAGRPLRAVTTGVAAAEKVETARRSRRLCCRGAFRHAGVPRRAAVAGRESAAAAARDKRSCAERACVPAWARVPAGSGSCAGWACVTRLRAGRPGTGSSAGRLGLVC